MALDELVFCFEGDEFGSLVLMLPKDAKPTEENKAFWEFPRCANPNLKEHFENAFGDQYRVSPECINAEIPKTFSYGPSNTLRVVKVKYIGESGKLFDTFDIKMLKIDTNKYKSVVMVGKDDAAEMLTLIDKHILNVL